MTINLDKLLEIVGVRTEGDFVLIREGQNAAKGKLIIWVTAGNPSEGASLTTNEARYLAGKLTALADKVDKKAKAAKPCQACGTV